MTSIITIHYNREENLANLVKSLSCSSRLPDELVIVNMGSKPHVPKADFPIYVIQADIAESSHLPIAKCRNIGASFAQGANLLFLDVDCLVHPEYIAKSKKFLNEYRGLMMGQPRYLLDKLSKDWNCDDLDALSVPHYKRPQIIEIEKTEDYGLFWSLCFGISSGLFRYLGGFDENFTGYGGEDTDIAYRCFLDNIPLYLTDGTVYHQQHSVYSPPVNHVDSIVANCNHYYAKHGKWCMDKHLKAFNRLGLIDWDEFSTTPVEIKSKLSKFEQDQYHIADAPYA